jgi:cytochrome c-type biogenesis protein
VNVGLSFLRGMVATVNPCGFVLLPTYLMYFLGVEASRASPPASERSSSRADSDRATLRRALLVGGAVTAGFMAVFVVVGAITSWFTSWLVANSKYVTGVAGAAFVVLGVAMLFGFKPSFAVPGLASVGERDRTLGSMFVYGIVYAAVSLSCTIGLFLPLLFEVDGAGAGIVNGAAFGLGMGLLVTALTVSLAVANTALLGVLRSAMQHVQLIAAAFVLLSGAYLLYYFWVVDVHGDSATITDAVERFQVRMAASLNDHWRTVAVVLALIVVAAIAYVGLRRRPAADPSLASPPREREPAP